MKKIIKSNSKKIIAAILCLITLISALPISQVLAWTSSEGVNCSTTAGVYLVSSDGGYYYYPETMNVLRYDKDENTTVRTYKYGKEREKYLLTYNGETKEAFCIEAGTKFRDSDNGYLSENYNNNSYFQNLPYLARYGIMLTAIYGYTDSVPGDLANSCNLDDFKCAAQIIIWEYQQQLRTGPWTINSNNGIAADIYYNTIKGRPAEIAYNWILQKISGHTTIPSFSAHTMQDAQTYTLKYNSNANNFSLTIQDTNNTLADLYFSNDSGVTVYRNGNNYTFTSNNIISNPITITAQKNINKNTDNMLIWGRSDYQTCMTGVDDPVVFYLKINTETYGSARIRKMSEDGIVKGVKFRITGNGIDEIVTTGNDGLIDVHNLLPGIYEVTEIVDEKYEPQKTQRVTVLSGQQSTVTFGNILKRGNVKVTKTSEDGFVENVQFHLYGKSISGLEVNEYAITNSEGIAEFNNILISGSEGYTLEEVDTNIKYVIPEKQNVIVNWNKVTNKIINNVLKKFNVTVTKSDVEYGSAQGDATLEGAVYGIYNNGQLIDEYTTDSNGQFTTLYYVCGDNWTIKEISPSKGYLLNKQVYHVGAEAKNYKIEYNSTKNDVTEQVIKGKILIIKHTDDGQTQIETPEKGAKFEVYLKSAGSYSNAKEAERDILTCDADGFAETKSLPYGTYTIHQISGWENREFIKDFDVEITENAKEYKYLINNREFESYIKMVKKDKNTGKLVTFSNATFSLHKLNEDTNKWEQVKCKVGEKYRTTWTTNDKGVACTETKLKAGKYKLCEIRSA